MFECFRIINHYKFTLGMSLIFVLVAFFTNSITELVEDFLGELYGFAPKHLIASSEVLRLFTSAILTHGSDYFVRALFMFILLIGWLEHKKGSLIAAYSFWGVHLLTLLTMTLLITISYAITEHEILFTIYHAADLGPSDGYLGVLGILIASLERSLSITVYLLVMALFVLMLWYHQQALALSADIAHLIAFSWGYGLTLLFSKSPNLLKIT